ncbi:MAG TPA: cell division protein FtsA [Bacillales bacterium]|nr:cell division protein FtsA [Bacillales bacterium]
MSESKYIFALDIGTRSVVGIILEKTNETFHIVDILSKEHSERSMLDGQIHDILSVSKIITEIKETLEKKYGPLHKVCVAAAGRSLKTEKAESAISIHGKPMLKKQDILHLELSAVQQAQAHVASKNSDKSQFYYCVGYSVLYYRLDGEEIGNLIDQQGNEASVEIIATFLPKVVVESLIAALHRAGLEMEALTLEPIAAINVLIPPSMRRLNVALVDIGAGTSDIAITNLGTVIAYGMVPVAGDEITEEISDQYLLDFPLAEKAKRELNVNNTITITDILGFETEILREEVITQISSSIDHLASSICQEILRLNNNQSPKAVMLVGGGSLTPELPKRVASLLQLPENRVAIRGIDAISSLTIAEHIHKGPELVTPIGIAIAAHNTPVQYVTVSVNEQPIRLFEIKSLTVGDCLLAAGIKMNKLYGKPGMAKIISLNSQIITIPGKLGDAPKILKNGQPSGLDDVVTNGDVLFVEKGSDGKETNLQISDLIDHLPNFRISLNQQEIEVPSVITCNGVKTAKEKMLEDRDEIFIQQPKTIEEILMTIDSELLLELEPLTLQINGMTSVFSSLTGGVYLNGKEASKNSLISLQDQLVITSREPLTVGKLAEQKQINMIQSIPVFFNDEKVILSKKLADISKDGQSLSEDDLIFYGDKITISQKDSEPFIFQDLFNYVDIEFPSNVKGTYTLLKNNDQTTFYDTLAPGDHLKIVWPSAQEIR